MGCGYHVGILEHIITIGNPEHDNQNTRRFSLTFDGAYLNILTVSIFFLAQQNDLTSRYSTDIFTMSDNHGALVKQFADVTGCDEHRARFFLESSAWELDVTISPFKISLTYFLDV